MPSLRLPFMCVFVWIHLVAFTSDNMGGRVALIFLFVFAASWACDARELGITVNLIPVETEVADVTVLEIIHSDSKRELPVSSGVGKNQLCELCQEYAGEALTYLAENKTQTEIIASLHKSCSKLQSLKQQCVTLVDYYAPLFFLELSSVRPDDFCLKVDLCHPVISDTRLRSKDSCGLCKQTMAEVLIKLQDPETKLEVIEVLLKACNSMQKDYVKKCKSMVFEYGPLILTNAEEFLETNDLCTAVHACKPPTSATEEVPTSLPLSAY